MYHPYRRLRNGTDVGQRSLSTVDPPYYQVVYDRSPVLGDKVVIVRVLCPQNGTAVLKRVKGSSRDDSFKVFTGRQLPKICAAQPRFL